MCVRCLSLSSKQLNITQVSWRLFCIRSSKIVAPFCRDCTQFNAQLKWMQRRVTSAICLGFKTNDCVSFPFPFPLSFPLLLSFPGGHLQLARNLPRLQTWRLSNCHKLCSNFCVSSAIEPSPCQQPLPPLLRTWLWHCEKCASRSAFGDSKRSKRIYLAAAFSANIRLGWGWGWGWTRGGVVAARLGLMNSPGHCPAEKLQLLRAYKTKLIKIS